MYAVQAGWDVFDMNVLPADIHLCDFPEIEAKTRYSSYLLYTGLVAANGRRPKSLFDAVAGIIE